MIFALNDEDPVSPEQMNQHTFRGARSILLLNSQGNRNKPDPSLQSFDILNRNVSISERDTKYGLNTQCLNLKKNSDLERDLNP